MSAPLYIVDNGDGTAQDRAVDLRDPGAPWSRIVGIQTRIAEHLCQQGGISASFPIRCGHQGEHGRCYRDAGHDGCHAFCDENSVGDLRAECGMHIESHRVYDNACPDHANFRETKFTPKSRRK